MKAFGVRWSKVVYYEGLVYAESAEKAQAILEEEGVACVEFAATNPFEDEVLDGSWVLNREPVEGSEA